MTQAEQSDREVDRQKIVVEADGPPMAYFEIPLDHDVSEAFSTLYPSRVVQRVVYQNIRAERPTREQCIDAARLVERAVSWTLKSTPGIGYGIIWWRQRPRIDELPDGNVYQLWMRLGTSPTLPPEFWASVFKAVNNRAHNGENGAPVWG